MAQPLRAFQVRFVCFRKQFWLCSTLHAHAIHAHDALPFSKNEDFLRVLAYKKASLWRFNRIAEAESALPEAAEGQKKVNLARVFVKRSTNAVAHNASIICIIKPLFCLLASSSAEV